MKLCLLAIVAVSVAAGCGPRHPVDAGDPTTEARDEARVPIDGGTGNDAAVDGAPTDGAAASTAAVQSGTVSGTAFWLGPTPVHSARRPLHSGSAHPRDWEGAEDAEFSALEDVVVSAIPVRVAGTASAAKTDNWPETGTLSCDGSQCPSYVTVATGDRLELLNFTRRAVSWELVKDGRTRLAISIDASRKDAPAMLDISALEAATYEILDAATRERRGWLYRAAPDEIVVGPTGGNCRYSISLPPGAYRIVAWHPHLTAVDKPVEIRAGIIRRVNPVFAGKDLRD